jgi:hypothetical protein
MSLLQAVRTRRIRVGAWGDAGSDEERAGRDVRVYADAQATVGMTELENSIHPVLKGPGMRFFFGKCAIEWSSSLAAAALIVGGIAAPANAATDDAASDTVSALNNLGLPSAGTTASAQRDADSPAANYSQANNWKTDCAPRTFTIANDTKYALEPYSIDDLGSLIPGCVNVDASRFAPDSKDTPQTTIINYPTTLVVDEYEVIDQESGKSLGIVGFDISVKDDPSKDLISPFSISKGQLADLYFESPRAGEVIIRSRSSRAAQG